MAGPTIARAEVDIDLDGSSFPRQARVIASKAGEILSKDMAAYGNQAGHRYSDRFGDGAVARMRQVGANAASALAKSFSDNDNAYKAMGARGAERFSDEFVRMARRRMRGFASRVRADMDRFGRDWGGGRAGRVFGAGFGQGALSRMDRTVALVIRLIASIGPQIAALGSALSAQLVAVAGSALVGLSGALIALAPAALAGVTGLAMAVKGIRDLREEVPGAVDGLDKLSAAFGGQTKGFVLAFADSLDRVTESLASIVASSTFGTALGSAFAQIADAFDVVINSPAFANFMRAMETSIPAAVAGLGRGFASLLAGLLDLTAAAAPFGETMAASFARWADGYAQAMSRMAGDGSLESYFSRASSAMDSLTGFLGPLTRALGNVFLIGTDSGNRMLDMLGQLSTRFLEFTQSDAGRASIEAWFAAGEKVFPALIDLVGALGTTLADMVTPDTINQVNDLLGTMAQFLPLLGQVLSVIGELNLVNLVAQALLGLGQAIEPLLPALTSVARAIGNIPVEVVQAIGVALGSWIVVAKIVALIGPLVAGIARAVAIFKSFHAAMGVLRAAWLALSVAFNVTPIGLLITAISALVAGLVYFFTQTETGKKLVTAAWEGIQAAAQAVASWFTGTLVPGLQAAWASIVAGVQAMGQWFADVWQAILDAPANIMAWFTGTLVPFFVALPGKLLDGFFELVTFFVALPGRIIGALFTLIGQLISWGAQATIALITWVSEAIPRMITWFAELPGRIVEAISSLVTRMQTFWNDLMVQVGTWVLTGIENVRTFFAELPGKVVDAISSLNASMQTFWNDLMVKVGTWVLNGLEKVRGFFAELPGKVGTALASLGARLFAAITAGMNEGNVAAVQGVTSFIGKIAEIPGKAVSALGSLGRTLYSAGRALIEGLIAGVADMTSTLLRKVADIGRQVTAKIQGVFGMASPSKVFADIGRNLMVGLAAGVDGNAKRAIGSVGSVADQMISAMNAGAAPALNGRAGVGAGNGVGGGRVVNINSGAIAVSAPTGDPYQVANAVMDRLVARAR